MLVMLGDGVQDITDKILSKDLLCMLKTGAEAFDLGIIESIKVIE